MSTKEDSTNLNESMKMKAALVSSFCPEYGEVDGIMSLSSSVPKPSLSTKSSSKQLLLRVLACSISPGDAIMIRGSAIFMHPSTFPFVPGMDVCGVVEGKTDGVPDDSFQVGDVVVASNGMNPTGGMAEYMVVDATNAVKKPPSVDVVRAASCSSAMTALHAVEPYVKEGHRVLVLGGSGGVGCAAVQLAKEVGKASFVATTSTQTKLCHSLGADRVIDYREQNWWEVKEFQTNKFDIIIDTVGGGNFTKKAHKVLKTRKKGGRFIAVTGDENRPDCDTWYKAIKFLVKLPLRPMYTVLAGSSNPGYVLLLPYDETKGTGEVLQLMEEDRLQIPLDPTSPLAFTEEGIKKAFRIQGKGHAHGKVVVKIAEH